jgi:ATP-dependent helicase/DNAse subunit B
VPRPPGVNAVYSEDDIRELREADIPLEPREMRGERELAWFHHVLEAPRDRIWLLWRTATPDGKPLLRSPFLNDVLRLFAGEDVERAPLRAGQYYPETAEAASARDALNSLFATGVSVPSLLAKDAAHVVRGADVEKKRYSSAAFDVFDGVLDSVEHKEHIATKYGEDHVFSPTELEDYRTCPFKFFALRLLSLAEVERPDTAFDRRELGIVVHEVLEKFHRRYEGLPVADIPGEEALAVMRDLVDEVLDARRDRFTTVPEGILTVERASVHDRLTRYLIIEREDDERWRPVQFEAIYGGEEGAYPPLELDLDSGKICMRGRIDRIDEGEQGYRVIDYKTGYSPSAGDVKEGVALQLVAYALALERVIAPGGECVEGALWQVGTRKKLRVRDGGRQTKWEEAKPGFFAGVADALRGIRDAWFPPAPRPNVCSYCEARRMCRIDSSRVERKQGNG